MESNDPLCVHFVFKCKYQDNAWILGSLLLLFRTLSLSINIWSVQLAFNFYLMCLWKTNLFLLMLCAIMKIVEGVWFIWCNLALSWESCFLIPSFVLYLLEWENPLSMSFVFYLICTLALPRYLQLLLIAI